MSPVFLVGCDRSGTTMLRLMLSRSPELHVPPETGFLPRLAGRVGRYGTFEAAAERARFIEDLKSNPATSKTRSFDAFGLDEHDAERILASRAPLTYPEAASALFTACAEVHGKPRWGDKTPRHIMSLPWLARAFPSARFIHIIRDPRAVAASLARLGWQPVPRRGARFWTSRVSAGRRSGRMIGSDRYMEVRYEDLVQNPRMELRRLATFAGLTFVDDMVEFHETAPEAVPVQHHDLFEQIGKPVDPEQADKWRQELTRDDVAQIEWVAGSWMDELGYPRAEPAIPRHLALRLTVGDGLYHALGWIYRRLMGSRDGRL